MSFNDLVTFATGVRFHIDTTEMIAADVKLAARIGVSAGERWLAVRGFRHTEESEPPVCWTEVYINAEFAAIGRLLPRHTGPIFQLIEDLFGQSVVEVHQQIAAGIDFTRLGGRLQVEAGSHGAGGAAHLSTRRRQDRAGRHQYPSGVALSSLDDDAAGKGLIADGRFKAARGGPGDRAEAVLGKI